MYYSDKPICNFKEDILGRVGFSKNLAETIYNYYNEDGLVIGIFGKWGTGKTSILNMVLKGIEIKENDENKPIIIRFTPWSYPSEDSLISAFLKSFSYAICKNANLKNEIGEALNKYSFMFDTLKALPYVGEAGASVLKKGSDIIANELIIKDSIDENKKKIINAIVKENKKIIVAIDDIDRLTKDQIRDVFQLVKQVANFPRVIYILAMDREVVTNALKEFYGSDGEEYLEKIVQIPFVIPEINHSVLEKYFESGLNDILDSRRISYQIDQNHWDLVFLYCIRPYLKTMRDANRILNVFQFKYDSLSQETSLEDLIALTVVEVVEPKLYKWIFENKVRLCGDYSSINRNINKKVLEEKEVIKNEFINLGIQVEKAFDYLNTLFKYLFLDNNIYDDRQKKEMRISDSMRFDIYFNMNLEEVPVSRGIINDFIHSYDEKKLVKQIEEIDKKGSINYFLTELNSLISEIPDDRKETIIRAIYKTNAKLKLRNNDLINSSKLALDFSNKLLKELNKEKQLILFKNILQKGSLSEIVPVCLELIHYKDRYENNIPLRNGLSREQILELENVFLENIKRISKNKEFFNTNNIGYIVELWDVIDEKNSLNFMKEQMKEKRKCLKYVCRIANNWIGTGGRRWSFDRLHNNKYTTKKEVKKIIDCYDREDLFKDFTEEELIKIASFVLNYNGEEGIVTEKEAKGLITAWKKDITK